MTLPTKRKIFSLAGESHQNDDGSSRQQELLLCEPGEPVTLQREPNNKFDSNAVAVLSSRNVGIGYLSKADAALIAPFLDEPREYRAKIYELRGGFGAYSSYGARITIAWDDHNEMKHIALKEEQLEARESRRSPAVGCLGSIAGVAMLLGFMLMQ